MFVSFLILVIVSILVVSITKLSTLYEFLVPYVSYCNIALWVALALFILFTVIGLIKYIFKWLLSFMVFQALAKAP